MNRLPVVLVLLAAAAVAILVAVQMGPEAPAAGAAMRGTPSTSSCATPVLAGTQGRNAAREPAPESSQPTAVDVATTEDDSTPEDPPPPAVYVQASDDQLPLNPTLRIHVLKPWDTISYREIGGSRFTRPGSDSASWEVRSINPQNDRDYFRGNIDAHGFGDLTSEALSRWSDGGYRLHVRASGFREEVVDWPQPLWEILTVRLESAGRVAHYGGRVLDDRGLPIASAGVFMTSPEGPGVRTGSDGRFDLAVPVVESTDASTSLTAVAPGFRAATIRGGSDGEEGFEFFLLPDGSHGHLSIRFARADGKPASRTRAWLYKEGRPWRESLGWECWYHDAPLVDESGVVDEEDATTRRLLARLVGGQATDDQGWELAQDAGPLLQDLVADDDGRLLIPAIPPGVYHLRAALAHPVGGTWVFDPPECYSFSVQQTLDTTITVEPPPSTTSLELRLQAGRTVTGRVEVAANAAWQCDQTEHRHLLRVDDWAWAQVVVRSGVSRRDGKTKLTGRFRFDGLPRTACVLRIETSQHPDVLVELPAVDRSREAAFDLGVITVPAARAMDLRVVAEDGVELDAWDGTVEIRGVPDALPQRWSGGRGTFILPTPPRSEASIVVLAKGKDQPVAVAHAPFDFEKDRPVIIRVAASPSPEDAR